MLLAASSGVACAWLWRAYQRPRQKQSERDAQLHEVFENLNYGIILLNRSGDVVKSNRAAVRLLGLSPHTMAGDEARSTFDLFLHGTLIQPADWPGPQALKGHFVDKLEVVARRRDTAESIQMEVTTSAILDKRGETNQVIVTCHDITKNKVTESAKLRLAAIVESSEDAIIGKNEQGVVTSWNKGAERVFGYTADEMIGASIRRLIPEDRAHEEDEILQRIRRGETVEHIETIRIKKNGKFIHVSLRVSPILDGDGNIIGASKIARNISDRKHLEAQLHQSQKMEAIGQLTGGIAHDFNNLLGIVIGNLDLLADDLAENASALRRVVSAQNASLRGAELIKRLLAASRPEAFEAQSISIPSAIKNVMDLASRVLGPEIKIKMQVDSLMPAALADRAGLESALLNLVLNARDAMPRGGTLTLSAHVTDLDESYVAVQAGEMLPGRYAFTCVSDTGHGMSKDVLDRAFEPMFTTKPKGKGSGLGLAMVYSFFKQCGGSVYLYSERGYGTTVSCYLPLADVAESVEIKAPVVSVAKFHGTVLVVDDEADLLEIAMVYLRDMGFEPLAAADGMRALRQLQTVNDIELLLTDVIMPGGINGVELAQKARALNPNIRVIYCSGFPADALAERSLAQIDGPLLHKPYQRAEFTEMIRSVVTADAPE